MALIDSLVSYWKLDGSSGNAIDNHGANTLTNNNTTTFATGKINNGADFERGSNQSFSITDASQSGLDITGDVSIQAWIKVESTPTSDAAYAIVDKRKVSTNGELTWLYRDVGGTPEMYVEFRDSSDNRTYGSHVVTPTPGTWYHYVVTIDVSVPTIKIYINGSSNTISLSSSSATAIGNNDGPFFIGDAISAGTVPYDGMLDEIGIWSRELTSGEVTSLYGSGSGLAYPFTGADQIAFDGASGGSSNSTTSLSYSHTVTSNTNGLLLVGFMTNDTDESPTGVTYNGVAMTQLKMQTSATNSFRSYVYGLLAPATGANNVVISYTNAQLIWSNSASYTGVEQDLGQIITAGGNGATTTWSINVTPDTDNSWVFMHGRLVATFAATSPDTQRDSTRPVTTGQSNIADSNGTATTASVAYTINGTCGDSAEDNALIAVAFAPAVSAAITRRLLTLRAG